MPVHGRFETKSEGKRIFSYSMAEIIRGRSEYHFREKNGNQKSFGKHRVVESPRNVSLLTRTKMKFLSKKRERERKKKRKENILAIDPLNLP